MIIMINISTLYVAVNEYKKHVLPQSLNKHPNSVDIEHP